MAWSPGSRCSGSPGPGRPGPGPGPGRPGPRPGPGPPPPAVAGAFCAPAGPPGPPKASCSGRASPSPSARRQSEETSGTRAVEPYGMPEAASMITATPLDGPRKAGSAGLPAGTQVRVVSRDGDVRRPCPAGTIGRVQIRGPGVITEYA